MARIYEKRTDVPAAGPAPAYPPAGYADDRVSPAEPVTYRDTSAGSPAFASGLNVLVGLWLIVAPWVLNYTHTGTGFNGYWNDMVFGAAIFVLAVLRVGAPDRFVGLSWVNFVIGIWLIIAPFVLAYNINLDAPRALWNDIICGIVVLVLAAGSAASARRTGRV